MKEYTAFVETLGVTNARDSAETVLNHKASYAGFKKPGSCDGGRCIDHIFHNDKASVKLFNTIIEDNMHLGSDHLPIYADVALS
jgi:endonuclease/exonuclease/phosphatase family metal-dependent hydrolase